MPDWVTILLVAIIVGAILINIVIFRQIRVEWIAFRSALASARGAIELDIADEGGAVLTEISSRLCESVQAEAPGATDAVRNCVGQWSRRLVSAADKEKFEAVVDELIADSSILSVQIRRRLLQSCLLVAKSDERLGGVVCVPIESRSACIDRGLARLPTAASTPEDDNADERYENASMELWDQLPLDIHSLEPREAVEA